MNVAVSEAKGQLTELVRLAESAIAGIARLLPFNESLAFYIAALSFGGLLGSFITEPAAMTLLAILLKQRYFDRGISPKLAYATLGLLFVNISIGGTLTHFAAPPVLMVASMSCSRPSTKYQRISPW